jgi:hypothetical protein
MRAGGVDEGGLVGRGVRDQELGDKRRLALAHLPHHHEEHGGGDDAEDEDHRILRLEEEKDGEEADAQHQKELESGLALLLAIGLRLLRLDDLLALACGDDADARRMRVLLVRVRDRVFELFVGKKLGHRAREHRLARTRIADEHDVAALLGRFLHDLDRALLADDLVDELLRDGHLCGGLELLALDPRIDGGKRLLLQLRFHGKPGVVRNKASRAKTGDERLLRVLGFKGYDIGEREDGYGVEGRVAGVG